jgi:poly-gamma-glutamate capsule biosynthesis protein CapA/YwtB (metallophosphatase superfamily)
MRARPFTPRPTPGTVRPAAGAVLCALALALGACAGQPAADPNAIPPPASSRSAPAKARGTSPSTTSSASASPAPATTRSGGGSAVLAFAGDVHFEGSSAAALSGRLGSAFGVLRSADFAMLNLETAITDRGTPQPKEFTFRAPARAVTVLRQAGIDAVSVANNHGMDYGRVGLADTLAAARSAGMPLLGAGQDDTAAWTPLRRDVNGVRVSVVAATDVLDDFAVTSWVAGPGTPGLASAKDTDRLLAAVRTERANADVVVVFLHWGQERIVCPTARQQQLARLLAEVGADVVVGSHAHVVQPGGSAGKTVVKYGMGNFQFYASGGPGSNSGVFTVTVNRGGATGSEWHPATIVGGVPVLLTGQAAHARAAAEKARFASC